MERIRAMGITRTILIDALLLVPALAFWICALLYVSLGNDFWFESTVAKIGITKLGNAVLIFLVVMCPGIVIASNGIHYMTAKSKLEKVILAAATIFTVLGVVGILS